MVERGPYFLVCKLLASVVASSGIEDSEGIGPLGRQRHCSRSVLNIDARTIVAKLLFPSRHGIKTVDLRDCRDRRGDDRSFYDKLCAFSRRFLHSSASALVLDSPHFSPRQDRVPDSNAEDPRMGENCAERHVLRRCLNYAEFRRWSPSDMRSWLVAVSLDLRWRRTSHVLDSMSLWWKCSTKSLLQWTARWRT